MKYITTNSLSALVTPIVTVGNTGSNTMFGAYTRVFLGGTLSGGKSFSILDIPDYNEAEKLILESTIEALLDELNSEKYLPDTNNLVWLITRDKAGKYGLGHLKRLEFCKHHAKDMINRSGARRDLIQTHTSLSKGCQHKECKEGIKFIPGHNSIEKLLAKFETSSYISAASYRTLGEILRNIKWYNVSYILRIAYIVEPGIPWEFLLPGVK